MTEFISEFRRRHPRLTLFGEKLFKDNVTFLAAAVSWRLLTSIVPILVGFVAISSLFLHDPATQRSVIDHLSNALQGTLHPQEIRQIVTGSIQHTGVFAIIGIIGILWGGTNVGSAFSTVFQPIFEVDGRPYHKERALDLGMIFVFVALMLVIIVATSAGVLITHLFPSTPIPGGTALLIGTPISLAAAFLLFTVLYMVFPNAQPRFTFKHVWQGALVAAVLFQILSFIWPLYTQINHFQRYSAVLAPMIVLAAWIYFFALILIVGAEIIAFRAIQDANRRGQPVGPEPHNIVPSHTMLRDDIEHVAR